MKISNSDLCRGNISWLFIVLLMCGCLISCNKDQIRKSAFVSSQYNFPTFFYSIWKEGLRRLKDTIIYAQNKLIVTLFLI